MSNSNLIQLMRSFDPYEMNSFGKFVVSPFFNKNEKLILFFRLLRNNYPDFNSDKILKHSIFGSIYPGEKYNDQKIRHLTNELLNLAEEFLAVKKFRKDKFNFTRNTLDELIQKRQIKLSEKKIKKMEGYLEDQDYSNSDFFYYRYQLSGIKNAFRIFVQEKETKAIVNDFIEEGESVIFFQLEVFIRTIHNTLLFQSKYNMTAGFNILNEYIKNIDLKNIIKTAANYNYKNYRLLEMYFNIIMLYLDPEDMKYYNTLMKNTEIYVKNLSKPDIWNLLNVMSSYMIERGLKGDRDYFSEQFAIYEKMLFYDVCFLQGYFNTGLFQSIASIALMLKKFDWVDNFIKKYKSKLNPESRDNILELIYSQVNFSKKNYGGTLEHLSKVKQDNLYYKFAVKDITIKTYYELMDFASAEDYINTYRHFAVNNKEITKVRRNNVLNFLTYIHKLIQISETGNKSAIKKLKEDIRNMKEMVQKSWLLEKLDEIDK